MAFFYHWSKNDILNDVFLDEALWYIDQITAEKLNAELVAIGTTLAPYYNENDRKAIIAKLEYQIDKLRGNDEIDEDVDPETIKRNIAKIGEHFAKYEKRN